jgi:hypothetical protein
MQIIADIMVSLYNYIPIYLESIIEPKLDPKGIVTLDYHDKHKNDHPNVGIFWNFYPFNWFFLPPIDWGLNLLFFPITIFTWPLWVFWNLLTLPIAILLLPFGLFWVF